MMLRFQDSRNLDRCVGLSSNPTWAECIIAVGEGGFDQVVVDGGWVDSGAWGLKAMKAMDKGSDGRRQCGDRYRQARVLQSSTQTSSPTP